MVGRRIEVAGHAWQPSVLSIQPTHSAVSILLSLVLKALQRIQARTIIVLMEFDTGRGRPLVHDV